MHPHLWVRMYDAVGFKSRVIFCWHCGEEKVVHISEEMDYPWPHEISTPTEE